MAELAPGNPFLLVFREVLPGDLRKHRAESNDADSGGGARDLRFRQAERITPIVARMFPNPANEQGVARGTVHWVDGEGHVHEAEIEFWRPTDARPGEVRLGRIYVIDGWAVDQAAYESSRRNHMKWFFFLVLDDNGIVWARLQQEEYLDEQTPIVRDYLRRRIRETSGNAAVMGTIDFQTGDTVP